MIRCDICDKELTPSEHTRIIKQHEIKTYPLMDLCEDCYQKLITAVDELVDEEIMRERREAE